MARHKCALLGGMLLCAALNGSFAQAQTITNGGFETGDLAGWFATGNGSAQVLTSAQFTPFSPTEGTYFALVGNGPSDVGADGLPDTAALTSQLFTISGNGAQVQYDLDFLTAEFTGMQADPVRLDFYSVSLLPQGGTAVTLETGDVSQNGFSLIDSGNVVSAPNGTSVIEHLGFHTASFPLNPGIYSLQFSVNDGGDGSFDSALLIDNLSLASVVVVPEVGGGSAAAVGILLLTGACAFNFRKKSSTAW